MNPIVISVRGISKRYSKKDASSWTISQIARKYIHRLGRRIRGRSPAPDSNSNEFWALKDVYFDVRKGERIGIIGRNGAGKSTLLKVLSRLVYPTEGEVRIRGRITSLLEVGTGFNMNLSGRENIYLNASLHGLDKSEIDAVFDSIVEFSEVGDFLDLPVKHYSSGMYMRLAFAVAAHLDTEILLLDEVLAVGDMAFQRKCLERVDRMTSSGRALLFVSHSMDAVARYCDRCIWLDHGVIKMDGDVQEVISSYVEAVLNVQPSVQFAENHETTTQAALMAPTSAEGAALESARVINVDRQTKKMFRVDEPIGIEMVYRTHGPGMYLPALHVYCPNDTLVFVAVPPQPDPTPFQYDKPVRVLSTAWLPVHLFNIGTYSVSLVVFSPTEAPFKRFFMHERILSFHCVDASVESPSARGIMPRSFPGPIRPLLNWTIENANEAVKYSTTLTTGSTT